MLLYVSNLVQQLLPFVHGSAAWLLTGCAYPLSFLFSICPTPLAMVQDLNDPAVQAAIAAAVAAATQGLQHPPGHVPDVTLHPAQVAVPADTPPGPPSPARPRTSSSIPTPYPSAQALNVPGAVPKAGGPAEFSLRTP